MFEHWPERRRRWFLITFSATAWALFCSSLASLGPHLSYGGLGEEPFHIVELVGTFAVWTTAWAMFKLRLWHWLFAIVFGASLTTALIDFGIRDHARAGIWHFECEGGAGDACHQLADFYADGRSPIHGWLDAGPLYQRACELGGAHSHESCVIAHSAGFADPPGAQRPTSDSPDGCYQQGVRLEEQNDLPRAYERYDRACAMPDHSTAACLRLLDTGFQELRVRACEKLEQRCSASARQCKVALARCERVRSPHAGTGP